MMLYVSRGVKVTSLLQDFLLPPLRDFALGVSVFRCNKQLLYSLVTQITNFFSLTFSITNLEIYFIEHTLLNFLWIGWLVIRILCFLFFTYITLFREIHHFLFLFTLGGYCDDQLHDGINKKKQAWSLQVGAGAGPDAGRRTGQRIRILTLPILYHILTLLWTSNNNLQY